MQKKLIISIDAGGIRGIIPLVILRAIQEKIPFNLSEKVHAWYGTSTGAVIAAGLLIQKQDDFHDAIQNVLDIYEFRSSSAINPFGTSEPSRALNKILNQNFGNHQFDSIQNLHVVTCRLPEFEIEIFNKQNNTNLATALKATCAVPMIFKPVRIKQHDFVDGFIRAKNPSLLAIDEFLKQREHVVLLSLGTGILREVDEIESEVRLTHKQCEELEQAGKITYFRFNPKLIEAEDNMQDTRLKNIFALKKDTENHLHEKREKLQAFIQLIQSL